MNPLRKLIVPAIAMFFLSIIGVIGYKYLQGWSLLESVYMVVITMTSAGWRDINHMTPAGRIFDMALVFCGVGIAVYILGQIVEMIIEGQISGYRRRRKMEKAIATMKNHYIICGFGRVGHQVAVELASAKIPYVILDSKAETANELAGKNVPYIIGDITTDKLLNSANIKKAKGLIAAADSDTENVFVTLSARVLNPGLTIIARASSINAEEKLKKAGANKVISPYFIAGKRMAQVLTKPAAIDYLDTVLYSEHIELEMRECSVKGNSKSNGKTLSESQVRQKTGAHVVAIRKADGSFNYQPAAESKIENGDVLVAVGSPKQLNSLQSCLNV
ncbi:MAG: NAD-binding protein [bacterium]